MSAVIIRHTSIRLNINTWDSQQDKHQWQTLIGGPDEPDPSQRPVLFPCGIHSVVSESALCVCVCVCVCVCPSCFCCCEVSDSLLFILSCDSASCRCWSSLFLKLSSTKGQWWTSIFMLDLQCADNIKTLLPLFLSVQTGLTLPESPGASVRWH